MEAEEGMRPALVMARQSQAANGNPETPVRPFPFHHAFGSRMKFGEAFGFPFGLQLSLPLGGTERAVNFLQERLDEGLAVPAFLPLALFLVHHGEVEEMRGQARQFAVSADGAAEGGEGLREIILSVRQAGQEPEATAVT